MRLNLGCGPDIKEGYINIDTCPFDSRVIQQDIRNLNFPPDSVDEIYAKDVVEHMSLEDFEKAVENWSKVCKSGATIFIQTICWDSIIKAYLAEVWDLRTVIYMLFAGKNWVDGTSRPEDFHKSAYSYSLIKEILSKNNFTITQAGIDKIDHALLHNPKAHNLNVMIYATKN